jgi:hypothetical protein
MATTRLFQYALCFLSGTWARESFVLDDMSKTDVAELSTGTVFEGSYEPCMADAYAGQFHHDWAKNKGNAHLTYHFDPPEDGCYKLEEYHPGGAGNTACSMYLPSNAKLHVEYCVGQSASLRLNQAKRGAQWNEIGEFPFYKGHVGRFTMLSSPDEVCGASSCFWVADAVRLTRRGEACPPNVYGADVRHVADFSTQAFSPAEASVAPARGAQSHDGTLRLSVRVESVGVDMQAQLEAHSSDVETALSLHYGGVEVDVLSVFPVSSHRRLAACGAPRRLELSTSNSSGVEAFDITFKVQGGLAQACTACPSLQEVLHQGFSDAGVGLIVEASTVSWRAKDPVAQEDKEDTGFSMLVLGLAVLTLVLCGLAVCWRARNCRKKGEVDTIVQGKPVEDAEMVAAEKIDAEKGENASSANMRDDASTATPPSEENNSLGDVELDAATVSLEPCAEDVVVIQPVLESAIVV